MTAPTVAFCIEQTLGHRAHTKNIERATSNDDRVVIHELPYGRGRVPMPWAVSASRMARSRLRRSGAWDVAFFHTQSASLFAQNVRRRANKYVVSVDATPVQLDTMGGFYRHSTHPGAVERLKGSWYRHVFRGAGAVVAWSDWAAESLVRDYGVAPTTIEVVHPGATQAFFDIRRDGESQSPLRVLFVGGDFERKGGHELLQAVERLGKRVALTIVTEKAVATPAGVEVLTGVQPASTAMLGAFAQADVFCLPTHGDCTPVVVAEAMAAGLPVVTTRVGSNPGIIREGQTGLLVDPGSVDQLTDALARVESDRSLRREMGQSARAFAAEFMNADRNALRLVEIARGCAE